MTVYVDEIRRWPTRVRCFREGSCHLTADTLEELHAFAARIGMRRAWFQDGRVPHYDQLPPAPKRCATPCGGCAFRADSPEREGATWNAVVESVRTGSPFHCHVGMVIDSSGAYVPRRSMDAEGRPLGDPVCAGWARARVRLARGDSPRRACRPVGRLPFVDDAEAVTKSVTGTEPAKETP